MSTITTPDHVFFYSGSVFSNFHWTEGQFRYRGRWVDSSEVGFMLAKALFFDDAETAAKIAAAKSSFEAKALGRQVRGYVDREWEVVREGFMSHVLLAKFDQNPTFAAELKATGDRILIEASPTDRVWGVGLDVEAAAAFAPPGARDEIQWPGRNLLGKALMTVRGLL